MTDRTAAKRVAAYTARAKKAGLVRVTVWVPKECATMIQEEAKQMRGSRSQADDAHEDAHAKLRTEAEFF